MAVLSIGGLTKPSDSSESDDETSGIKGGMGWASATSVALGVSSLSLKSASGRGARGARGCRCLPAGLASLGCLPLRCRAAANAAAMEYCSDSSSSSGRYVLPGHPRAGSEHRFGVTTMGERS